MTDKITKHLICLLIAYSSCTLAQPVQQWQDRHGEWHFGDPHAAPTRGSRDVHIQQPISVVNNPLPLPIEPLTPPNRRSTRSNTSQQQRMSRATEASQRHRSKADCENLRESLRLNAAQQQHQQRQQQYERECVMGVYYADSQQ